MADVSVSSIFFPKTWRESIPLALLAWFAPSFLGQGTVAEPYLQGLASCVVFAGILVSTTNLSGPLRYGLRNYKHLFLDTKLTDWAPSTIVCICLLAWSRLWLVMGSLSIAWQYVREQHREAVAKINGRLDDVCAKAAMAVEDTRAHSTATERYERQALDLASIALREARKVQNLRVADFFDTLPSAWTELDLFDEAVKEAAGFAEKLDTNIQEASRKPPTGSWNFKVFEEKVVDVNLAAEDLTSATKKAKDQFVTCKEAKNVVQAGRERQESYATEAANAAKSVSKASLDTSSAVRKAVEHAETVRHHVAEARRTANEGDLEDAGASSKKAEDVLNMLFNESQHAASARSTARKSIAWFCGGSQ